MDITDYIKDYDIEREEYIFDKRRKETLHKGFIEKPLEEPRVREVRIASKQAMPHMEDMRIEPLKRVDAEVVGGLFERVDFLKDRINEIGAFINQREGLHKTIAAEIDSDIRAKEAMEAKVMDFDEKRNIRLDISLLRKEKRQESLLFWKDVTELKSELRELLEKYQVESKIAGIFKEAGE